VVRDVASRVAVWRDVASRVVVWRDPASRVAVWRAAASRVVVWRAAASRVVVWRAAASRVAGWLTAPLPPPPAALRRGPFRRGAFDSRSRSPRLTSLLGVALAVAFTICFVTGLISHFIQHPPFWFGWPSRPVNLYRATQGVHVATGLASVPLLGAKLWSVYPRLFAWPPARNLTDAIERASIAALVAAALFQLLSGILNIAHWYEPMPFFFTAGHYWSAWLAIGALLTHIGVKLPIIRTALSGPAPDRAVTGPAAGRAASGGLAEPEPEPEPGRAVPGGLTGPAPGPAVPGGLAGPAVDSAVAGELTQPTTDRAVAGGLARPGPDRAAPGVLGRRGLLGTVAAAAGVITLATVGQTVAPLAPIAVLAPRRPRSGPQHVPVNKTAGGAGVRDAAFDPGYRLTVVGPDRTAGLALADLAALPQHTVVLPISCVEGWSSTGTWTGVRLRDLVALVGVDPEDAEAYVESLEARGRYRATTVPPPHVRDPFTLVALRLGGEPLHPDHGYPARLIAPNRPGVLQTKWVARITARGMA